MNLKRISIMFILFLTLVLTFTFVGSIFQKVNAVTSGDTIEYPFKTIEYDFATVTAPTTRGSSTSKKLFFQVFFAQNVDLSNATYLAVQIKYTKGAPGMQYGVIDASNKWINMHSGSNGNPSYYANSSGNVGSVDIVNDHMTVSDASMEMALIPMSLLNVSAGNIKEVTSFFMCTKRYYNWDFEFKIGEIGYYTGEPTKDNYVKLVDRPTDSNYYNDGYTVQLPTYLSYPFSNEKSVLKNGTVWAGPVRRAAGTNWNTLTANFDNGSADLSNASYLAIQMINLSGAPRMTIGLESSSFEGLRYSIDQANGSFVYTVDQIGRIKDGLVINSGAVSGDSNGFLLIPMSSIVYQFGTDDSQFLSKVDSLKICINTRNSSSYNWEMLIGEIGYYTGEIGGNMEYHTLLDIAETSKISQFTTVSDRSDNYSTLHNISLEDVFAGYYNSGSYTKDTTIFVDAEKVNKDAELYFHAKCSDLVRRTVYSDGKLVMTTETNPNGSGYKDVEGDMVRFHYVDGNEVNDFTVKNTSVEDYYVTLYDFVVGTSGAKCNYGELVLNNEWSYSRGVYSNSNKDVLEAFKLFAAPMWIGDVNYVTLVKATVYVDGDTLVMQLWASQTNSGLFADGYTNVDANGNYLFAEARITK